MVSRSMSTNGSFDSREEAAIFAGETLVSLLPKSIDTTSVSITITIQERSEGYSVSTVIA